MPLQRIFDAALFVVVPAVVYALMLLNWTLDPFFLRNKIVCKLLPELSRFPSATSRRLALHTARGGSLLVQMIPGVVTAATVVVLILMLNRREGQSGQRVPSLGLSWIAVILAAVWLYGWLEVLRIRLLHDSTRKSLRQRLNRIGLPTCVACGFNMKGIATGVCSECGAAQSDSKHAKFT